MAFDAALTWAWCRGHAGVGASHRQAGLFCVLVKRLNEATAKAMADPELRKQLIQLGIEPTHSTPEQFSALILTEIPKWKAVVSSTGATNN